MALLHGTLNAADEHGTDGDEGDCEGRVVGLRHGKEGDIAFVLSEHVEVLVDGNRIDGLGEVKMC